MPSRYPYYTKPRSLPPSLHFYLYERVKARNDARCEPPVNHFRAECRDTLRRNMRDYSLQLIMNNRRRDHRRKRLRHRKIV